MGALALAWITGEGIICWQSVRKQHHPPIPGQLLGSSAIFAVLAVIAEFGPGAARAATLAAWAFDVSALFQVLPGAIGVPKAASSPSSPSSSTGGAGGGPAPKAQ